MRLNEKPYPGEPVTLPMLARSRLILHDCVSLADEDHVVWRGDGQEQGTAIAKGCFIRLPQTVALGYDAECPDWRDKLTAAIEKIKAEVAVERLQEEEAKGCRDHGDRLFAAGRASGMRMAIAAIRKALLIEEENL